MFFVSPTMTDSGQWHPRLVFYAITQGWDDLTLAAVALHNLYNGVQIVIYLCICRISSVFPYLPVGTSASVH